jgi:hypothetical protein
VVCIVSGSGLKDTVRAAETVGRPHAIEPTLDAVHQALPNYSKKRQTQA